MKMYPRGGWQHLWERRQVQKFSAPSETFHIQKSSPRRLPISLVEEVIIPSLPYDGILSWVLLSIVQLTHGKPLGLLPAMVYSIQHGLGHWQKLFVDHRLSRAERGNCFLPTGLALRWRCLTHIWWHGSHYTVPPSSSPENSRQKWLIHLSYGRQ